MAPIGSTTFGSLLKQLRKRAGMTQADLAAAVGYSIPFISNLELNQRLPDLQSVLQLFVPALGLQDEPHAVATLLEQAALARGERLPTSVTMHHTTQVAVYEELRPTQSGHTPFVKSPTLLPASPTELIGRTGELHQLCNRLLGHSGRLLTLIGPPGIGKTTLALALAARLQLHYADGAVFVPLAAISDPTLLAATILTAVGSSDLNPPEPKLIAFLRHKSLLLVLDNLEQISAAAPFIAELVAACRKLAILATSRERLHLRAEQRFQVPPLDLAPALELFVQRAQAVAAHFRCTPQNQAILEEICHRLDGLPLAIELCAAQIDLLAPSQLLAQLQTHRLDLLVDGAHDLPPRQRTLRTAIGASYSLLTESERLLLRTLGVFVGGFALTEVTAVVADRLEPASVQPTLHALIGKSLVHTETLPSGEQRFLLLETIREFALEQMRAQGEENLLCQCHYQVYLQRFRATDRALRGAETASHLARLRLEQDNLRAALQWSYAEARYEEMSWLISAANWFWFLCDYGYERGRWLQRLWTHRHALAGELHLSNLIMMYGSAIVLEELQPITRYHDELMQLLEESPYKLLQAVGWYFYAQFAADVRETEAALARSVALARAADEAPTLGEEFCCHADRDFILPSNLLGYGTFLLDHGEIARAREMVSESLQRFQRTGNQPWIIGNLGHLGHLALLRGDLAAAHQYFDEVATLAAAHHYLTLQGEWQPLLALVTLYRGDTPQARHLLHESLAYGIEMKQKLYLARNYAYLAEVALCEGELDQSSHWLAQSLNEYADPGRNAIFQVERLWIAARLATAQQHYERAAPFGLAEQMHSHIHHVIAGPMRALADAAPARARETLEPMVFADAFATGQQMALEAAFASILAPTPIAGVPAKA